MTTKDYQQKGMFSIFLSFFKPHRGLFFLDMVCALFVALVDLAYPVISRKAINTLLPNLQYKTFFIVMGIVVLAYVVRSLLYYVITYWGHTFGIRVEADIREALFTHMQTLGFDFYDRNRTGHLMSRLTTDLFEITELAHHGPEDLFIAIVTITGALIVMFTIEWRLALVVCVLIPVAAFVIMSRRRAMGRASRLVKQKVGAINADIESCLSGMRTATAFANEAVEAEKFRRSNEDAQAEIARRTEQAQALHAAAQEKQAALDALSQEKLALEARRTATERESREANDTLLASEREVSRLEQKLNASAMEEKQILDRLWERYELSHSEAQAQRVELESVPKATRRIAELTRDIKALGTPNIGAIEEFERVNTRYTYLSEQRTDVERAMGELTGVIDELTDQMTKIFAEQFRLLNETFQETFLELFGGGKARLELEDESDILGCGIEIKVQPPGKQLKTITLLSGGEKAFVAIALYFAILKVHPTPFCVMDEIEAALDESNVVRYARYMRRIAGKTQFIVITHRRGTMEEADVLYGVTMQERGISKVLTINLNDMAKELKIK